MADLGGYDSPAHQVELENDMAKRLHGDIEAMPNYSHSQSSGEDLKNGGRAGVSSKKVVVHGLSKPMFHVDLTAALQSAITNTENRRSFNREEAIGEVIREQQA